MSFSYLSGGCDVPIEVLFGLKELNQFGEKLELALESYLVDAVFGYGVEFVGTDPVAVGVHGERDDDVILALIVADLGIGGAEFLKTGRPVGAGRQAIGVAVLPVWVVRLDFHSLNLSKPPSVGPQ
jgi:hypothetical protein